MRNKYQMRSWQAWHKKQQAMRDEQRTISNGIDFVDAALAAVHARIAKPNSYVTAGRLVAAHLEDYRAQLADSVEAYTVKIAAHAKREPKS